MTTTLLYVGNECLVNTVQDVVFVVDTSSSVGLSNFQLIREFIGNISAELLRKSPGSAVGVILFNDYAHIQFNLQAHTNLSTLLPAINQLPYSGGRTDTNGALKLLLSSAENGTLKLKNSSSNVAIIITDGESNSPSDTLSAASALHASKLFDVYAVGVSEADLTKLRGIASSQELVFFTSFFGAYALQLLQNRVLDKLCTSKQKYIIL